MIFAAWLLWVPLKMVSFIDDQQIPFRFQRLFKTLAAFTQEIE
ncbi:Uncharacterised protein [Vibrio cholerae]|nr:Uncharacterised protein [Vibrio cholerae]